MGIFDKVKNLFTEEVDEDEVIERKKPVKKESPIITEEIHTEEKKVEIAPALKETADMYEKEKDSHKEGRRSLYFSDDDFDDIPTIKSFEEPQKTYSFRTKEPDFSDFKTSFTETKKEEKEIKKFKPSPIISPIYGVLDKNYNKEDIKVEETKETKITVDDVREKAFSPKKETKKEEPELDIFEELKEQETKENNSINNKLEEEINDIKELHEEINETIPVEEQETTDRKIDNILEELNEIQELIPDSNAEQEDAVEEGDLFNLIDSMYEKRDNDVE